MNTKAQGFDVFKLLISAVVAVVLLTMLLNIIGMINPDVGQDPMKKTKELTTAALTNLNTTQFENQITFNNGVTLTSLGIAANSDELTSSDVCIVKDSRLGSTWETEEGTKLSYTGSSAYSAKIAVVCGYADQIEEEGGVDSFFSAVTSGFQIDDFDCTIPEDASKYCIVAIKKSD